MSTARVLVTGASGFLGQEIVQCFADKYSVIATGRRLQPSRAPMVNYVSADLLDNQLSQILPDGIDTVVHAAGLTPPTSRDFAENVTMTRLVTDWAVESGVLNMVLISSASVYAPTGGARLENCECRPDSNYGKSKLESERYALSRTAGSDVNLIILRIPTLIGPTHRGNVARLIRALKRNRFLLIGDGTNYKSLLHVSDSAMACLEAVRYLQNNCRGEVNPVFNVSDEPLTMAEIINIFCAELGKSRPPQIPAGLVALPFKALSSITFGARPFSGPLALVDQFQRNDILDASLFQREVGFEPRTDIRQALRNMARYNTI